MSPFPVVTSKYYDRLRGGSSGEDKEDREDTIYFGIDTGTHWFAPLGGCFALSAKDVERAAKRVIRVEWQYVGKNRWDEDERHKQKIFGDAESRIPVRIRELMTSSSIFLPCRHGGRWGIACEVSDTSRSRTYLAQLRPLAGGE